MSASDVKISELPVTLVPALADYLVGDFGVSPITQRVQITTLLNLFSSSKGIVGATISGSAIVTSTMDSTPIGNTTPSTGKFTTVSGDGSALTGTAAGLTAGNVTTNANLTGGVTSVGNAATVVTNANLTGGVTSVGNAATVVTNANLTGPITSVGNATSVTAQTGTGTTFAMQSGPTFTGVPLAPTAAAHTNTTQLATTAYVESEFASPPTTGYGNVTPGPVAATTITATSTITPAQLAGIVGTITNDNVNAGGVGEYITATSGAVSLASGVSANIISISLTAGDWNVWGNALYLAAATTTTSQLQSGISVTSATIPANPNNSFSNAALSAQANVTTMPPMQRISLAGTTTVFLIVAATFAVSTATATAQIMARRVR